MRMTKILATLGPASRTEEMLTQLIEAGVDGVRLNFSHGTPDAHRENAALVRRVSAKLGKPVAILGDLQGPKIRVGRFEAGKIILKEGQPFSLTMEPVPGDDKIVSMTFPLAADVLPGDELLLDDGLLALRVTGVKGSQVDTVVVLGGELSNNKGINVPSRSLSTPAITDKDKQDVLLARELQVDYIALSFVRKAQDVLDCKELAGDIPLIAKLEKPEALVNLEEIIAVSDGVMVARGDLGVEVGSEKVPLAQKRIIAAANKAGKLVITATQMLDSMIRNPRPTRAETTDIANAVLDGTDVVMLSGETASGTYPVDSVKMMSAICQEVETSDFFKRIPEPESFGEEWQVLDASTRAAAQITRYHDVSAIIASSSGGRTATVLSHYRPHARIIAVTTTDKQAARLALRWGVRPVVLEEGWESSYEVAIARTEKVARENGVKAGASIALVLGSAGRDQSKSLTLRTFKG